MALQPTPQPRPAPTTVPRPAAVPAPKPSKLAGIVPSALPNARRFFIYGVRKWGKSTWAADAPSPIFIDTMNATEHLHVARYPNDGPWTWTNVIDAIDDLPEGGTYERPNGDIDTVIDIVETPMSKPPYAEDTLGGHGAVRVVKASIFPATMFLDLKAVDQAGYSSAFRAYQLWSRARAVGKDVRDLQPSDYDETYLDLEHRQWLSAGGVAGRGVQS